MTLDLLLGLTLFAAVTSVTPGPNNALVFASGATFGLRRTVPHMLGIAVGVVVMTLMVGAGLGGVFRAVPLLYDVLQVLGALYLLHLAWRIARSAAPSGAARAARPMTLLGAALFQWVNPKAWIIVIAAVTAYAPQDDHAIGVVVVALVFGIVSLPSLGLWACSGVGLARVLGTPERVRRVNLALAALLVLSLVPLLAGIAA